MPDQYDPSAALYEQLSQMGGQLSLKDMETMEGISGGATGGIKAFQQRMREMLGSDAPDADIRDLIIGSQDPRTIEMMIEGSNVSEEDAALGMAKLEAIKTYGTGEGRVHDYADGSQEWVPEGMAITGRAPYMIRESQTIATRYPRTDEAEEEASLPQESLRKTKNLMRQATASAGLDPDLQELIRQSEAIQQESGRTVGRSFQPRGFQDDHPRRFQEGGLSAVTGVGEPKEEEDEDQPLIPNPGNMVSKLLEGEEPQVKSPGLMSRMWARIRSMFGFAEGGLVTYANYYAKGGPVRFANGGLAAVAGMPDDDDDDGGRSDNLVSESLGRLKMNRDEAIRSLKTGREALLAQKRDKSAAWLRFAQGMLAPTKTGGFGESLGQTAGLLAGEKEAGREAELDRSQRLREIDAEMREVERTYAKEELRAAQKQEEADTARLRQTVGAPFNAYTFDQEGDKVLAKAVIKLDEDGNEFTYFPRDEKGRKVIVPDNLDPELLRRIAAGKMYGKEIAKDDIELVNKAFRYKDDYARALYGLELLDQIDRAGGTGGIQAIIQKAREFFGDEAQDVTDRGTLMNLIGGQLFKALESFGTQINRKELEIAQSLVGSISRPSGINRQMLQNWAGFLEWHMGYANTVAKRTGEESLMDKMAIPLPNYGLDEARLARAQRAGFTVGDYIPWDQPEEDPEEDPNAPGAQGSGMVIEAEDALYEPSYQEVPRGKWFKLQLPDGTVTNEYRQN